MGHPPLKQWRRPGNCFLGRHKTPGRKLLPAKNAFGHFLAKSVTTAKFFDPSGDTPLLHLLV